MLLLFPLHFHYANQRDLLEPVENFIDNFAWCFCQVNIKSYASNNELAVMPQDRVQRMEWNRRYLSVLGVENNRLYELRLQTPENVFLEEEKDLRQVMDSFRVNKVAV